MIEFAHIELFWLLALPFFMLLLPVYRQRQASVRVPFFDRVAELSGQKKPKSLVSKKAQRYSKNPATHSVDMSGYRRSKT